jgi:hypothetical protein
MMKFFYVSTFLLFVSTAVNAKLLDKFFDKIGVNLDNVGVRVLLNQGKDATDGSFCNEVDRLILQTLLNVILPLTRRNLRKDGQQDRDLASCRDACKGFPRGQCYLVYSKCWEYRRALVSDEEEEEVARRFLANNVPIEASEKCHGMETLVESQLVKLITQDLGLSLPCLQLAEKNVTLTCILMN